MGRNVVRASFVRAAALGALLLLLLASNPQSVLGGPEDAPSKPTGLTGDVYHDRVELRWDEPADDDIVTGYRILRLDRAVHGLGNFQVHVDDTGSPQNSYTDTNVEPDTRYVYRIHARNGDDLSPRSKWFDADTPEAPADPEPTDPPAMPTGLTGTASHDRVALRWDDPADDDRVTGYQVLRGNPVDGEETEFSVLVDDTGSADSSYTDGDVDDDTAYAYRIRARNAAGLGPESDAFDARTPVLLPPAAPQVFAAHVFSSGNVVVEWTSDAGDHSITGYRILRGLSEDSLVEIEDDTGLDSTGPGWGHYTDATAPAGRTVYYAVQARNDAGLSPASNAFEAVIPGPAVPGAPWLMASGSGPDGVFLLWAQDPPDDSITGYRILRGESEDSLAELVADTGSTDKSYTDADPPAGRTVYYAVQARNANGLSQQSNTRSADIPAAQEPLISQRQEATGATRALMSYTDNRDVAGDSITVSFESATAIAQQFTTGPGSRPHLLHSVEVYTVAGNANFTDVHLTLLEATLHRGGGTFPSDPEVVYTLTSSAISDGPATGDAANVLHFTAPEGAVLQPNTTYWLRVRTPDGFGAALKKNFGAFDPSTVGFSERAGLGWTVADGPALKRSPLTAAWEDLVDASNNDLILLVNVNGISRNLMDYIGDIDHIGTVGRTFLFKPPQDPVYDGDTRFVSQAFRTAGGQRNHLLDSLDLHTFVFNTPLPDSVLSKVEAWLHRGTDWNPYIANQVYVLTPSEIVDERTIRFTAPDGATLLPNTIYWVNVRAKENFERAVAFHSGGPGFSELAGGRWYAVQTEPARHRTSDSADWVDARTSDTAMAPLYLRLRVHGFDGVGDLVDPELMDYVTTDTPFIEAESRTLGVTTGVESIAQQFATEGGLFPHDLDSIELYTDDASVLTEAFLTRVEATIHWGNSPNWRPRPPRDDELVYTLTPSAVSGSATTGYVVKFDAPEGAYLLPGARYWLHVRAKVDTGKTIGFHNLLGVTEQVGRGWSTAGIPITRTAGSSQWTPVDGGELRLRVKGTPGGGERDPADACPPGRFKSLVPAECEVDFPDPTLRGIIEGQLGLSPGDPVMRSDLERITRLRAAWRGIASIEGLQYATGLVSLDVSHNRIAWFDLGGLPNLAILQADNNDIIYAEVYDLPFLSLLRLSQNRIADAHLRLGDAIDPDERNLTIDLSNNELATFSLGRVSANSGLETLNLGYNNLSRITIFETLDDLKLLKLNNNDLTFISFRGGLDSLETVDLSYNSIPLVVDVTNLPDDVAVYAVRKQNINVVTSVTTYVKVTCSGTKPTGLGWYYHSTGYGKNTVWRNDAGKPNCD